MKLSREFVRDGEAVSVQVERLDGDRFRVRVGDQAAKRRRVHERAREASHREDARRRRGVREETPESRSKGGETRERDGQRGAEQAHTAGGAEFAERGGVGER